MKKGKIGVYSIYNMHTINVVLYSVIYIFLGEMQRIALCYRRVCLCACVFRVCGRREIGLT